MASILFTAHLFTTHPPRNPHCTLCSIVKAIPPSIKDFAGAVSPTIYRRGTEVSTLPSLPPCMWSVAIGYEPESSRPSRANAMGA